MQHTRENTIKHNDIINTLTRRALGAQTSMANSPVCYDIQICKHIHYIYDYISKTVRIMPKYGYAQLKPYLSCAFMQQFEVMSASCVY